MRIKKLKKLKFIPLEDIKKINKEYLDELEVEKKRLQVIGGEKVLNAFEEKLLLSYESRIDLLAEERAVDYVIKKTEIRERARVLAPWRRCWLARLLFLPTSNRAQDIIEERAKLDADFGHTAAEKAIDNDRKRYLSTIDKKLSKREYKRLLKKQLKAALKKADQADLNEALEEPSDVVPVSSFTASSSSSSSSSSKPVMSELPARRPREPQRKRDMAKNVPGELPGQMNIADVENADKRA